MEEEFEIDDNSTSIDKEFRRNDNDRDQRHLKDTECTHKYWIKRCSLCKTIMESDSKHNCEPGEATKQLYTDLDALVCTQELAKQIKDLKIVQKSRLYWIESKDCNIASLRSRENVSLRSYTYSAAFTTAELCRHFYRLDEDLMTHEVWEYIGKNAVDPNRIARLLVRLKKEHDARRIRKNRNALC